VREKNKKFEIKPKNQQILRLRISPLPIFAIAIILQSIANTLYDTASDQANAASDHLRQQINYTISQKLNN
jgi:hypothetical protein